MWYHWVQTVRLLSSGETLKVSRALGCIHGFPLVLGEPLESELALSCLTDWVCSLKWENALEAASRLLIEPMASFSLGSTELSLTLQTAACTAKSPSACHCHQNHEDWRSLRAIFAFLWLYETKNLQSERDFAWSCSWMNGSLMGYMWFCVENRIMRGEV